MFQLCPRAPIISELSAIPDLFIVRRFSDNAKSTHVVKYWSVILTFFFCSIYLKVMKSLKTAVAVEIHEARKSRDMQQHVLADIVGISRTSISNIEKGKQGLSLDLFCRIAAALDYQPSDLLKNIIDSQTDKTVSESEVSNESIRQQITKAIES